MIYFGCGLGKCGHFHWDSHMFRIGWDTLPAWMVYELDGTFYPRFKPKGTAALVKFNGWTIVAFEDRTQDERPGSNSAFLLEGDHEFDAMVAMAKEKFPRVLERFGAELVRGER